MSLEPHSSNFPPSDPSPGPSASPFSAISPSLPTTTSTYAYSQPAYALGTTLGIAANLNAALQLWKSFNYSDAQRGMDSTAAEMASKQDESEASRRRLVELSREFKTKTPEEVRRAVSPLLKQFQSEIDTLTRRCKSAESAFLSLYKQLIDLPDPVPLLEHANAAQKRAQRVTDLEIENKQLRDTLEQYNTEFAHVRNQEITVKQLRERLRETEERVEATVRECVKEREQQLARQLADREAQAQERESDLLQQLNDAKHQNSTLQHALESSQNELMDVRTKYEELLAGKLAEIEMLAADVERSAERAAAAEQQLERVRRQQQQQSSAPSSLGEGDESALALGGEALASAEGRPAGSSLTLLLQERQERLARLELELSTKDRTIAQLVADVQRAEGALARLRDATAIQGAKVQSELSARNQRIAELEQRIAAQSDYSEVKRELEIFKAVEFGSSETSDAGGSSIMTESSFTPSPAHSSSATSGIPLEQLVLRKNKTLQAQLVQLKSDHAILQESHEHTEAERVALVRECDEQRRLVAQLEADLERVRAVSMSAVAAGAMGAGGVPVAHAEHSAQVLASLVSPDSLSTLSPSSVPTTPGATSQAATGGSGGSAADSLLPIIQSQRDRFRQRVTELEALSAAQTQQISRSQNESDRLRADNSKLYEKIRFLQQYGANKSAQAEQDTELNKYSQQYEARLDPFHSFNKMEKQTRLQQMQPYEKLIFVFGRLILTNRRARLIAFLYTIFLHLFVFFALYLVAHSSAFARDMSADCQRRYAEHMLHVHGSPDQVGESIVRQPLAAPNGVQPLPAVIAPHAHPPGHG